jgi:CrcB protein
MPDWFTHPITMLTVGGALGTNARYWLGRAIGPADGGFPWATFSINVLGSALLGVFAALWLNQPERRVWFLLLGTGFCGGFTTFSTFSLETLILMQQGRPGTAAIYAVGSVVCGLMVVWLAIRLAR